MAQFGLKKKATPGEEGQMASSVLDMDDPAHSEESDSGAMPAKLVGMGALLASTDDPATKMEIEHQITSSTLEGWRASAYRGVSDMSRTVGMSVMKSEHVISSSYIGNFAVGQSMQVSQANALSYSTGYCARAVRVSLEAGGIDLADHPSAAKDYNALATDAKGHPILARDGHQMTYLETKGFEKIPPGEDIPPGAVVVINEVPGHPYGHIALKGHDGKWRSDFVQRDMFGGEAYRHGAEYTVYKFNPDHNKPQSQFAANDQHKGIGEQIASVADRVGQAFGMGKQHPSSGLSGPHPTGMG